MRKTTVLACSLILIFILVLVVLTTKFFQKKETGSSFSSEEIHHISEHLGHLVVDTLHEYAPHYDLEIVIQTIRRIEVGKEPLKALDVCQHALFDFKCKMIEAETHQNLVAAERFLTSIAQRTDVVEVKKNKLYYEILQRGQGRIINRESSPLLHFMETNLENKVIRDTREENEPLKIKLSETIAGFCQGVCGMQIGERRKIYVHPDLAYGKLSRNQLSIFEVEILED